MTQLKYSMLIQWSEEDNCYVVTSPEWTNYVGPSLTGGGRPGRAGLGAGAGASGLWPVHVGGWRPARRVGTCIVCSVVSGFWVPLFGGFWSLSPVVALGIARPPVAWCLFPRLLLVLRGSWW